jgi:hypothetical protein
METFTVGQMAELLELAHPSLSAAFHARQIRGWAQAGLFPDAALRGSGRTAAQIFQRHHLVVARIYGVLAMMGMTVPQLRRVAGCFQNGSGVRRVTEAYATGDHGWRFILYLTNEGEVHGGGFFKELKPNLMTETLAPNIIVLAPASIFRGLAMTAAAKNEEKA